MAAANPSPRRSSDAADGAREGEKPRRGTSHGVALAMAIGLTLLLVVGRVACVAWMNDVEQRPVVAPAPATNAVADEPPELREPGASPDPSAATAERVEVPAAGESEKAPPEWRARVEVVEIVDATIMTTAPLAGAEVRLSMWSGETELPLARLITGESGVVEHDCSAALARLPALGREAASLQASASARLHRTDTDVEDVPRDGGVVAMRLELRRGAEARGRVVDGTAAPVAKAWVSVVDVASGEQVDRTVTSFEGRFELPIWTAATWRLQAAAYGVGGIVTSPFAVEPAIDVDVGDLVLAGSGAVGGRVVNGRGAPLADVLVEAFDPVIGASSRGQDEPRVAEAGLRRSRASSRLDGTFLITGLAPGLYRLATPSEPSVEQDGGRLHELGDESAVLVVTRHLLRIVVQDESGEPIAGAQLVCRYGENAQSLATDARGRHLFHGAPLQRVIVSAIARDFAPAEGEHTFAEEYDDVEMVLTLRPIGERSGTIALVVEDDGGHPLRPAAVTLRTALGTNVEGWRQRPLPETGRVEPLAPGRYMVEVHAGEPLTRAFPESSLWFPATTEVDVRAAETAIATLRLRAGGRVRYTLRVPPDATTLSLSEGVLELVTTADTRRSLGVGYRVHNNGTVEFGGHFFDCDIAYLAEPLLEPGAHRLRFTAPRFLPLEQSFTIRAGQITDVDLLLEPE